MNLENNVNRTSESYLFDFSPEIAEIIFIDNLDRAAQLNCAGVSKKISDAVFYLILSKFKTPIESTQTYYSQLMQNFRLHCHFFCKKLPGSFEVSSFKTFDQAKETIDAKLKRYVINDQMDLPEMDAETFFKLDKTVNRHATYISEIWLRFMQTIDPQENIFHSIDDKPQFNPKFNDTIIHPEQECQILLRAGVYEQTELHYDVLSNIIKQTWCSSDTLQMMIDRQFTVSDESIISALSSKKFESFLPQLFNLLTSSLSNICNKFQSKTLEEIITKNYLVRKNKVSSFEVNEAMRNNYSKEFVLQLIDQCKDEQEDFIREALELKFDESFIQILLKRNSKLINSYCVRLAMEKSYSLDLVTSLLNAMNPNLSEYHQCDDYTLRLIYEENYSKDLIPLVMSKINKKDLFQCINKLIEKGADQDLIEKYLPDAEGHFDVSLLKSVIQHKYSEEFFIKICAKTNPLKSFAKIDLTGIVETYSEPTIKILLDKGAKCDWEDFQTGLNKEYQESTLIQMMDLIDTIQLNVNDIAKKAKNLGYSETLLEKIRSKSPSTTFCIIS